jgi:hypothetical protein
MSASASEQGSTLWLLVRKSYGLPDYFFWSGLNYLKTGSEIEWSNGWTIPYLNHFGPFNYWTSPVFRFLLTLSLNTTNRQTIFISWKGIESSNYFFFSIESSYFLSMWKSRWRLSWRDYITSTEMEWSLYNMMEKKAVENVSGQRK